MNGTAPPTDDQAPPLPPPPEPELPPAAHTGTRPIIGGVGAALADGLGLDPLWVRIGLVLLALVGGLGLVVYAALWLVLVVGARPDSRAMATIGGAVLVVGVPIILGGFSFDNPLVLIAVLGGVALALWQPRAEPASPAGLAAPSESQPGIEEEPASHQGGWPKVPRGRTRPARTPRPRRPRSPLGAITVGLAMVVASVGALIDQANGGRLHPEQWLGAAAVVCGVGLLVGTIRGHARWLIVPALALAGIGALAGEMARLDIGVENLAGNRWEFVDPARTAPLDLRTGLGDIRIEIAEVPTSLVHVDARAAVGTITVVANTQVAVDVQHNSGPPERIGRPDGEPDMVVNAKTGLGQVRHEVYWFDEDSASPTDGVPEGLGELTWVADGVAMTADGWFVLAEGAVVLDEKNTLVHGEVAEESDGVSRFYTAYGEFGILPRGLLITPYQQVIDLEAVRAELVEVTPTTMMIPRVEPETPTAPAPEIEVPTTQAAPSLEGVQP